MLLAVALRREGGVSGRPCMNSDEAGGGEETARSNCPDKTGLRGPITGTQSPNI